MHFGGWSQREHEAGRTATGDHRLRQRYFRFANAEIATGEPFLGSGYYGGTLGAELRVL